MSHSQFHSIIEFILRHAWLNLRDKHMTTGRINQVTLLFRTQEKRFILLPCERQYTALIPYALRGIDTKVYTSEFLHWLWLTWNHCFEVEYQPLLLREYKQRSPRNSASVCQSFVFPSRIVSAENCNKRLCAYCNALCIISNTIGF